MQVISNRFLHLVKTDFAFDKKTAVSSCFCALFYNFVPQQNDLWI